MSWTRKSTTSSDACSGHCRLLYRTLLKDFAGTSKTISAVLQANLTKLDLLSRDEFLAQAKVLERTRAQLDELERRLAALEARSSDTPRG